MTINLRKAGDVAILDLKGPLKMGEAEESFRGQVLSLLESGARQIAVNLAGVPEVDSSGIGSLVRVFTSAKAAGGKCLFFGAPKRVRQTLRMVRLDSVLEPLDDEAAALARF